MEISIREVEEMVNREELIELAKVVGRLVGAVAAIEQQLKRLNRGSHAN